MRVGRAATAWLSERCGRENGAALIVVLWIFIFLFVVAFEFSTAAREEATAAHRFGEEAAGYYLAVAGFERGLYHYLGQSSGAGAARQGERNDWFDGEWREEDFGGGRVRVRLVDEGGKINVNRVSDEQLRRVLTNLGLDNVRRDVLVDSLMDWRDPDDLHRTNGAEKDYYAGLAPAYAPKNGPLDSVEEMLWIRGMSAGLFYGYPEDRGGSEERDRPVALRDIFTVDSPIDRVNLRTASAEVIHALLGIPLEKCRTFIEERKKLSEKALGDLLPLLGIGTGHPALQMFIFANPSVVAVEAEGKLEDARLARRVKGIVRLGGTQRFEVLRWVDRELALQQNESLR